MKRSIGMLIMTIFFIFTAAGCGQKEAPSNDRRLIARINNYEITVDDFKDEAGAEETASEELLEEMITKNVLLQEAQRQNFDKDRAFMKEIEKYWEQALLKLLIKKKSAELARTIRVTDEEVKNEYDRLAKEGGGRLDPYEKLSPEIKKYVLNTKIQGALEAWQVDLRNKANIKIYRGNLKGMKLK